MVWDGRRSWNFSFVCGFKVKFPAPEGFVPWELDKTLLGFHSLIQKSIMLEILLLRFLRFSNADAADADADAD